MCRPIKGGFSIFQQVTLEDKPIFDRYFRQRRYENAECTFTNMYMWRKGYSIEWAIIDEYLCIKAGRSDSIPFLLCPFGLDDSGLGKVIDKLVDYFSQQQLQFIMKGVSVEMMAGLQKAKPDFFSFEDDRNNHDYVYSTEDLINLAGRKYHSKQNHINFFKRTYDYRYEAITPELIQPCMLSAREWYTSHNGSDDDSLKREYQAIIDVLANFQHLAVQGGAIMLDNKVAAFTFGEKLNSDTAVIHVEKGLDVRGLYQVINQEFCRTAWADLNYVNREEDMGIEGLRRAKQSYHPVKMIKKYSAELKARRG
jgi:uncharacterized protein